MRFYDGGSPSAIRNPGQGNGPVLELSLLPCCVGSLRRCWNSLNRAQDISAKRLCPVSSAFEWPLLFWSVFLSCRFPAAHPLLRWNWYSALVHSTPVQSRSRVSTTECPISKCGNARRRKDIGSQVRKSHTQSFGISGCCCIIRDSRFEVHDARRTTHTTAARTVK